MKDCYELYLETQSNLSAVAKMTLCDGNLAIQLSGFSFISEYEKWLSILSEREEIDLYRSALAEYHLGLFFVSEGLYRSAFYSLRYFLEYSLFAIQLSTSDFNFRSWKKGNWDLVWASILDTEKGVLSKSFTELYFPDFINEVSSIQSLAKQSYRDCSEFIHGNYAKNIVLPSKIEFEDSIFKKWHSVAESVQLIVVYSLFVRFNNYINTTSVASTLEPCIMNNLGGYRAVIDFYDIERGQA